MTINSITYALDRGLDSIVFGEPQASTLPVQSRLLPWELGHLPELDRLLVATTLEDVLDMYVRPRVRDRDLLSPTKFRAALLGALANLRANAKGDTDTARLMRRCQGVMLTQDELLTLLGFYIHALHQG